MNETCERCQGAGEIVTDWRCYLEDGHDDDGTAPCPDCDGRGDEPWEGELTPEENAMVDAAWQRHEAARPK